MNVFVVSSVGIKRVDCTRKIDFLLLPHRGCFTDGRSKAVVLKLFFITQFVITYNDNLNVTKPSLKM